MVDMVLGGDFRIVVPLEGGGTTMRTMSEVDPLDPESALVALAIDSELVGAEGALVEPGEYLVQSRPG
jgi:hypothetical protein